MNERVRFVRETGLYEPCQLRIVRYGNKIKVTYFKKLLRVSGCEESLDKKHVEVFDPWPVIDLLEPPKTMSEKEWDEMLFREESLERKKLDANVRRAKQTVYELAMCNDFEYFATFTIDGERYARDDLKGFYKSLSKWMSNYSRISGEKIKYLLIPELHKDEKNWHMHGLISGVPVDKLKKFGPGMPKKLRMKGYMNWPDYAEKFGFCSLDKIRDETAVSAYITKYISKDVGRCVTELGAHMYYCSQGLKRKELICRMPFKMSENIEKLFDFSNEWVASVTVDEQGYNDLITKITENFQSNMKTNERNG